MKQPFRRFSSYYVSLKAVASAVMYGVLSASAYGQTSMQGMDHSNMPGMQQTPSQPSPARPSTATPSSAMPGIDHSTMPGMQSHPAQPSPSRPPAALPASPAPGMDHRNMPGMDHGNMPGMQHTPSQPLPSVPSTPVPPSMPSMNHGDMPGMDHSNMPGMQSPAPQPRPASPSTTTPSSSMPGMNHGNMLGMDHGSMPSMQHNTSQPKSTAPQSEMQRMSPVLPYPRNPDGSISIPGKGMAMLDDAVFHMVLLDRLEYSKSKDDHGFNWDGQFWVGKDYNRLWVKTEGERTSGQSNGRLEALWSKPVSAFWDFQAGVRHDFGAGKSRQWAAFGIQGISPYWFDVEAAAYVGPSGRTAVRAKAEYTIRLSQVLLLTPEIETNAYGKADKDRGIGSGLSDVGLSLRLRYEIRREIAPYIGINWGRKIGQTADLARQAGESPIERQVVTGVRLWF
jgi:copper resistance protein B